VVASLRKPLVARLPAPERVDAYPWPKTRGGLLVCPECGYETNKPEAHELSAVCYVRTGRKRLADKGFVPVGNHAVVVALSGCSDIVWGPIDGTNATHQEVERVEGGLFARHDVIDCIPPAPESGLTKLSQNMRAAILVKGWEDREFLAYIDTLRRLGTDVEKDSAVLGLLASELAIVKGRQTEVREFINRFNTQRRVPELRYLVTCVRTGAGLPESFWSHFTTLDMRAAVVQYCLSDEGLAAVLDAARRFDRRLDTLVRGVKLDLETEDPLTVRRRLPWRTLFP
jgi:hypothetical protein